MNKKMIKLLVVFMILFSLRVHAQGTNGYIIKTELSKLYLGKNPNLGVEKLLNERFSVQLEGIWKRRDRVPSGGEYGRNYFRPSTGYGIIVSTRYYFTKKREMPFTSFVSAFVRYNNTRIKNLDKVTFRGYYLRTVDIHRHGPELGILFGRQFLFLKHFTTEVNAGLSNYYMREEQTFVSGQLSTSFVDGKYKTRSSLARPYLNVAFGYFFNTRH